VAGALVAVPLAAGPLAAGPLVAAPLGVVALEACPLQDHLESPQISCFSLNMQL